MFSYPQNQLGLSSAPRYLESSFNRDTTQDPAVFVFARLPRFSAKSSKWLEPAHNVDPPPSTSAPTRQTLADPTTSRLENGPSNPLESIDESMWDQSTKATAPKCKPKKAKRIRQEAKLAKEVAKSECGEKKRAIEAAREGWEKRTRTKRAEGREPNSKKPDSQKPERRGKKGGKKNGRDARMERRGKAKIDAAPLLVDFNAKPFPGRVIHLPRFQSKPLAVQLCQCDDASVLTLWTDGSLLDNNEDAGAAVAYRDIAAKHSPHTTGWEDVAWKVAGHNGQISYIEFVAIVGALNLAYSKVLERRTIRSVFICSDSLDAIHRCQITRRIPLPTLDYLAQKRAHELVALGVSLTLVWTPAHCYIEGNSRADIAAGAIARAKRPGLRMDRQDSRPEEDLFPPSTNKVRSFTICRGA
ncbi:hypothetical protein FHETE_1481 [Fusarium heterosporum]|uniref:RNase H type-1 domain-containing protein n=1 Tax=Fusarium heterosporum TaxID=42747 RepID=A0A8H5TXD9_FUSHE|nr:hypothetical protein FHETE_1481 [Fusarium heterosporum]